MARESTVTISARHCKGCRLCIEVCPRHALRLTGKLSESGVEIIAFDPDAGCTGCLMCAMMCPDAAVTVEITEHESPAKK